MELDDALVTSEQAHYTDVRPALWGDFSISKAEIPYFQSILTLEEVTKQLELVEDLPADLRSNWRLEELFQREIDWERVQRELVDGYLRQPHKLKFFNSLTVALLPLDENRKLDMGYNDILPPPPLRESLTKQPWQVTNVGGVQIIRATSSPHAFIRWNPKRIFPATIDGQHRLAALKTLHSLGNLPKKALDTGISVIFLVLDSRAGLVLEDTHVPDGENPVLTVVREVFIDLNMHAQSVARARQILLDDQGIESRCLRQLLAPKVGEEVPGRLPLGLVHWQHNESAKFNTGEKTGPFITTIELLNSIVRDILDLKRPKDPTAEEEIRDFLESIEASLSVSSYIKAHEARYSGLPPLRSYVEENYLKEGFEKPFANPPAPYIRACADSFSDLWRPVMINVFLNFKPYADFIEEVRVRGGIDGDIAYFLCQPWRAQRAKDLEWGEEREWRLTRPLRELDDLKKADWPFYAVFQKALFRATKWAFANYDVLKREGGFNEAWLGFLNDLWSRGVFALKSQCNGVYVWAGTGLNIVNPTVRWAESAVQRMAGLLLLWWYFYTSQLARPSTFMKRLDAPQSNERFPNAKEARRAVCIGLEQLGRQSKEEPSDTEIKELVKARLRELLALARNSAAADEQETETAANGEAELDVNEPVESPTTSVTPEQ
jgi:hypothetical protein